MTGEPVPKGSAYPTHAAWLIAGTALYATAASLEWLIADTHGVPVASIHEHTIVPGVVHALAIASIPVSLFPVFRGKPIAQPWFRVAGGVVIAVLLFTGLTLSAGLLAWTFSAGTLVWQRHAIS